MAKIHGVAYLVIGFLIFAFSYYIDKNIKKGFALFIYVGLVMMIMGIMRLAKEKIKNKKETKTHQRLHHTHHQPQHPYREHAVFCPRCGTALSLSANYCYKCGNRIHIRR